MGVLVLGQNLLFEIQATHLSQVTPVYFAKNNGSYDKPLFPSLRLQKLMELARKQTSKHLPYHVQWSHLQKFGILVLQQ